MQIKHSRGSYEIRFRDFDEAMAELPPGCLIVTDDHVLELWGHRFPLGSRVHSLPPGEASKSLSEYQILIEWMIQREARRGTMLAVIGGGVVGDLAGFAAATYMRGIPLVQIPTTLLAQVDASVGGKVGIDLPEGKNLLGCFYQPLRVEICAETMGTLPLRHFKNGMAEVVKYGVILDPALLGRLSEEELTPDHPDLREIIRECVRLKADVVAEDEFETTGKRAILNFGHTVGHALETVTGYGPILHGEAVCVGMRVEAKIAELIGHGAAGTLATVEEALSRQGLPASTPELGRTDELLAVMRRDKKATGSGYAFALPVRAGECKLVTDVPESAVKEALQTS
jgi:3-dehydroquinate synthase